MTLKLFESLRGYRKDWLRGDVIAGLTVWAVLVPESLAYAGIAGVTPVVGLYAAPAALLFYAMLGSSRHLVVGPMSATAALSAASIADYTAGSGGDFMAMTATLAIATGLSGIAAGLLRLGFISNFISEPVLKGFIIGLALTIIAGQLPALFGVEKGSGDFFEKLWDLARALPDTDGWTLAVGLAALAIILTLRRVAPRVPASLVAVLFGVAAVALFGLDEHGVDIVGHIDSGLPGAGYPDGADLHDLWGLMPAALGVLLVGYAEGLGAANHYAEQQGYEIDANQELLGLGGANLAAGFVSGMVVNGSLSKTAVNGGAGARSQVSGLVVAALTVLTLLLLTGLFEQLPESVLAAVVIVAVLELVDPKPIERLYRRSQTAIPGVPWPVVNADFLGGLTALFGVLVFDTLPGLFIGVIVSIVLILLRISTPRVAVLGRVSGTSQFADIRHHLENAQVPGLVILRPEGGMFFANAEHIGMEVQRLARRYNAHTVVLDVEEMAFIDATAAQALGRIAQRLEKDGRHLALAHPNGQVRDALRTWQDGATFQSFDSVESAVEKVAPSGDQAP